MKELLEKINAEMGEFVLNSLAQIEKGNKAAGVRARNSSVKLGKMLAEFRKKSLEETKKNK